MFTILFVEDQSICREPLAKLLRYEGYEVVTACNGLEALEELQHREIDLLLFDLIMPKMNGLALLQAVRQTPQWSTLSAIALTGTLDSTLIAGISELGVNDMFSKMRFSVEELLASIRQCLNPIDSVSIHNCAHLTLHPHH